MRPGSGQRGSYLGEGMTCECTLSMGPDCFACGLMSNPLPLLFNPLPITAYCIALGRFNVGGLEVYIYQPEGINVK